MVLTAEHTMQGAAAEVYTLRYAHEALTVSREGELRHKRGSHRGPDHPDSNTLFTSLSLFPVASPSWPAHISLYSQLHHGEGIVMPSAYSYAVRENCIVGDAKALLKAHFANNS